MTANKTEVLDCAILDPLNPDMLQTVMATDLVLGKDRYAQKFSRAFRQGLFQE